uniref:Gustatory receptor n=1 Tax=Culicoides sonorensis TaxID=179676 RepID=A0A336MVM5_CULSO
MPDKKEKEMADTAEQFSTKIMNPHQRRQFEDYSIMVAKKDKIEREDKMIHHIYVRNLWLSAHLKAIDAYDSFYKNTKALLILFQIMGVVPITRNKAGRSTDRTSFSWTSKECLWAYFLYSIQTALVISVGYARIDDFVQSTDQRFDIIIHRVIFLTILLVHFILPFASWRNGPKVAEFKNIWTRYQTKHARVCGEKILFDKYKILTWSLCFLSWALSFVLVLGEYYLQPDFRFWHTFAYYHNIATLNCFCSLWVINCTAFSHVSENIIRHLSRVLKSHPSPSSLKLSEFRHLWIDLSQMMRSLSKVNSDIYSLYLSMIFFVTIIASYGSISEIIDHGFTLKEVGLFMIVFYCMGILYIICNKAHQANIKVGYMFQQILFGVNTVGLTQNAKKEIQMFIMAIQKNPPIMSLNGYVTVDRGLVSSSVTFITTYLIVLMQFKFQLVRTANKAEGEISNSTMI